MTDLTPVRLSSFATSSAAIRSARRPSSARISGVNRRELFLQLLCDVCCKGYIMRRDSVFKQCPWGLVPDVREERDKRNGRVTLAYYQQMIFSYLYYQLLSPHISGLNISADIYFNTCTFVV